MAEQSLATATMTLAELDAQMRTVLASLTSAAATATQNATSCQELRVTTERIMKAQDAAAIKVSSIEMQVQNIGNHLTSMESTITSVLTPQTRPEGRHEVAETQGI